MNDVVIAGAGPNGLMLAGELGLAGMRPVVLEPLAGPNPQRRANGITGQAVRLLDHRGLYTVLAGAPDPPQPSPWAMFAAMAPICAGDTDWSDSTSTPTVSSCMSTVLTAPMNCPRSTSSARTGVLVRRASSWVS